jgi:hypothetical protein
MKTLKMNWLRELIVSWYTFKILGRHDFKHISYPCTDIPEWVLILLVHEVCPGPHKNKIEERHFTVVMRHAKSEAILRKYTRHVNRRK